MAIVTPGQQAPLGMTLSLARRLALLEWAKRNGAWIVEDDYLSELQLTGRAAPALASLDHGGRVLHIGSFSKTLSPTLRLGFMVVPPDLVRRFGDVAACLAPAPAAGDAAGGRGITARRVLSAPSASHEAPLRDTKGRHPSCTRSGRRRHREGKSDGWARGRDRTSAIRLGCGYRFAGITPGSCAFCSFALVHAAFQTTGIAARRHQYQRRSRAGGLQTADRVGALAFLPELRADLVLKHCRSEISSDSGLSPRHRESPNAPLTCRVFEIWTCARYPSNWTARKPFNSAQYLSLPIVFLERYSQL